MKTQKQTPATATATTTKAKVTPKTKAEKVQVAEKVTKATKAPKATKPQTVVLQPAENCPFGYPKAGGKCAAIWRLCESLLEKGVIPTGQQVWQLAQAENESGFQPPHNLSNCMQETLRCRRYYGFGGRRK
jgi:hypothetical protein|nr:MAG TPA: hypothetical protein [Caudoviricetes sp.]